MKSFAILFTCTYKYNSAFSKINLASWNFYMKSFAILFTCTYKYNSAN
ncbi:hypothetical protein [Spiroplasma endosymbiont of Nephrotoma flavescens]